MPDVVFEDSLERALQIKQGTTAAELKTAVKRLFDVLEEVKRRAENNEVNCFQVIGALSANLFQIHFDLRLLLL